jgi:sigma-B regulation protein RsbU (phosphoserine phosphatase)
MSEIGSDVRESLPRPEDASEGGAAAVADAADLSGAFALLAELTQGLADSLEIEDTLERALGRIAAHVDAEAGSLWLLDDEGAELVCRASVGPQSIGGLRLPITEGVIGRSVRENRCQLVEEARKDPEFAQRVDEGSHFETRSLVCAPLSFSDRPLGAIELVNKRTAGGRFSERDRHLLQVLASSAALAIANARMASQAVDHERVRRELELAAEIQRSLLPATRPSSLPVFGLNVPARAVSGDFFDFLELDDQRIAFCLGDVSGKGMNAALMATKTASLYRYLARSVEGPGRLLQTLNDELVATTTRGMFVTMVAGVLDRGRGVVCLASAGHEPPLLYDARGQFAAIPAQAPPLAILPDHFFPESELRVDGGTLYVFSDGLTEASCESGEWLGSEGMKRLISRFAGKPLEERVRSIIADVRRLELRDDLTLIAVSGETL